MQTIQKLVNLEVLNNSANEFKLCHIGGMQRLRYLMLDGNKLTSFKFTGEMPGLTHISVRDNSLKYIEGLEHST
jgi:Leucine-rich repeat (LRR) protein